jgi:hypothetical protein
MFVAAYPCETQEMVLDAHNKVFTFFGRDKLIFNPWHYLPVLERKPGVLRHGINFQDWDCPNQYKRFAINY